nr:hypothetical protein OG781_24040 [Streptomyces sp. NBC_00830]
MNPLHADETFTRAATRTVFLHVASPAHLTLMHTGDRSAATIDAGDQPDRTAQPR